MTQHWYLMPIIGTGTRQDPLRAKYISDVGITDWAMMDYGLLPVCIAVADVTSQQHSDLIANADVHAVPLNLDAAIGPGAVTTVRALLEGLAIPGNWVQASDTWRTILRTAAGLFQFAQRLHAEFGITVLGSGATLDTTWAELPQGAKDILLTTAQMLGIDTSAATGSTTLRQIYKAFADAWGAEPFFFGDFVL
jgi:hypothetical protein